MPNIALPVYLVAPCSCLKLLCPLAHRSTDAGAQVGIVYSQIAWLEPGAHQPPGYRKPKDELL